MDSNSELSLEDRLKLAQIAAAEAEAKLKDAEWRLKEHEIKHRPTLIKSIFTNGGLITGWVAIASLLLGQITGLHQAESEREKRKTVVLIDAYSSGNPSVMANKLEAVLMSCLVSDNDGRLYTALSRLKEEAQLPAPAKPNCPSTSDTWLSKLGHLVHRN